MQTDIPFYDSVPEARFPDWIRTPAFTPRTVRPLHTCTCRTFAILSNKCGSFCAAFKLCLSGLPPQLTDGNECYLQVQFTDEAVLELSELAHKLKLIPSADEFMLLLTQLLPLDVRSLRQSAFGHSC